MKANIAVLGEGAWGTAIAQLLAYNGNEVNLWCNFQEVANTITKTGINSKYLPHIKLITEKIKPLTDSQEAIKDAAYVFSAIPIFYLRSVLRKFENFSSGTQQWISLSKGIENESCLLATQIMQDVLKHIPHENFYALSGPSFAADVVNKQPTGGILAGKNKEKMDEIKNLCENDFFKIYFSNDLHGVQAAGAFKNIIALARGLLISAGFGDNTQTLAFMKGIDDMKRVIAYYGGSTETCHTLAGLGDAVLTTFGTKSRNVDFGKKLGQGQNLSDLKKEFKTLPEGINTVQSLQLLVHKQALKLPFLEAIYSVIYDQKPIKNLINKLF